GGVAAGDEDAVAADLDDGRGGRDALGGVELGVLGADIDVVVGDGAAPAGAREGHGVSAGRDLHLPAAGGEAGGGVGVGAGGAVGGDGGDGHAAEAFAGRVAVGGSVAVDGAEEEGVALAGADAEILG